MVDVELHSYHLERPHPHPGTNTNVAGIIVNHDCIGLGKLLKTVLIQHLNELLQKELLSRLNYRFLCSEKSDEEFLMEKALSSFDNHPSSSSTVACYYGLSP